MWQQTYEPVGGSLAASALVAALPVFALLYLLGIRRKPGWMASLLGLATAAVVAMAAYRMPPGLVAASATYGAGFGLFPIGWIVYSAIVLYRVTEESGKFALIKDSIGHLTPDPRLQALLIAFAFGAFLEGASGFGTPVAVGSAMLAGLGFSPFYAAGICLLANTSPVAFASLGVPVTTLAGVAGLPAGQLSAVIGGICAPVALFVPAYLIAVMSGWKGLRGVAPAAAVCGLSFAITQWLVAVYLGPQLTGILAAIAAMGALIALLRFWRPRDQAAERRSHLRSAPKEIASAWLPYILLVCFMLAWVALQPRLDLVSVSFHWPALHNAIERMSPVVAHATPYGATFNFNWLSAAGTASLIAAAVSALALGMSPMRFLRIAAGAARQLAIAELTLAAMMSLAFLMNYSGATGTLGLAFAATGRLFPFFSPLLGWLGVFLTGSDTSANALFGSLQVVTAQRLGMNPALMAGANSAGGVMGKMISLTSIAVAVAATNMERQDESRLFRFTLRHSILLAAVVGLVVVFYAYMAPNWVP